MRRLWRGFRSILGKEMEEYLTCKRALGCRFDHEESGLRLFDGFLVHRRVRRCRQINCELIEEFIGSRPVRRPRSYNHLLGSVRRLLKWLFVQGRINTMPTLPMPRRANGTRLPFIFDRSSAQRLLNRASTLPDYVNARLRGPTYRLIFALLYGLGLRVSEACHLRHCEVDFDQRLLVIRRAKFGKTRLVPFGPRVKAALADYIQRKTREFGTVSAEAPLFTFDGQQPINRHSINRVFRALVRALALPMPPGIRFPRTHDLRHSFAVGALLRWYRSGVDPSTRLLHLSTFLGHVDVGSTAVYLTMTPELLTEAHHRFERLAMLAMESNS